MRGVEEKTEAEPAGPDAGRPVTRSQARDGACAPGSELRPVVERRQTEAMKPKLFVIGCSEGISEHTYYPARILGGV